MSHWGVETSPSSPRHRRFHHDPLPVSCTPERTSCFKHCPTTVRLPGTGLDWSRLNKSPLTWQHQLQWWEAGTDPCLLSTWLVAVAFKCLLNRTLQSSQYAVPRANSIQVAKHSRKRPFQGFLLAWELFSLQSRTTGTSTSAGVFCRHKGNQPDLLQQKRGVGPTQPAQCRGHYKSLCASSPIRALHSWGRSRWEQWVSIRLGRGAPRQ